MGRELISLRLEPAARRRLAVAARRRSRSVSELVRTAIVDWLDREEEAARNAPYDAMLDLVGVVSSARVRRSSRTRQAARRKK